MFSVAGKLRPFVMIEAITRLLPGVLGNPDSLVEESHAHEGFLEYPNYTKPLSGATSQYLRSCSVAITLPLPSGVRMRLPGAPKISSDSLVVLALT